MQVLRRTNSLQKHLGWTGGRVICSSPSVARRASKHRERPQEQRSWQVPFPQPQPQHQQPPPVGKSTADSPLTTCQHQGPTPPPPSFGGSVLPRQTQVSPGPVGPIPQHQRKLLTTCLFRSLTASSPFYLLHCGFFPVFSCDICSGSLGYLC